MDVNLSYKDMSDKMPPQPDSVNGVSQRQLHIQGPLELISSPPSGWFAVSFSSFPQSLPLA